MTKEEAKQWLRSQIDSSLKIQHDKYKHIFYLYYNNSYLRALKLATITGQTVNENGFNGGEELFWVDSKYKEFWHLPIIREYLNENYSKVYTEQCELVEEVINEYEEYNGCKRLYI